MGYGQHNSSDLVNTLLANIVDMKVRIDWGLLYAVFLDFNMAIAEYYMQWFLLC